MKPFESVRTPPVRELVPEPVKRPIEFQSSITSNNINVDISIGSTSEISSRKFVLSWDHCWLIAPFLYLTPSNATQQVEYPPQDLHLKTYNNNITFSG